MPAGRYHYYYGQFTAYIPIIAHEAQALDSAATAATSAPVETPRPSISSATPSP